MKYEYRGQLYSINELSELSGIEAATIRYRLRRGYPVSEAVKITPTDESVFHFTEASWWEDWVGMTISDLYTIYWKWCISNGYTALQKQGFSRQIFKLYPNLKTVPMTVNGICNRYIRLR